MMIFTIYLVGLLLLLNRTTLLTNIPARLGVLISYVTSRETAHTLRKMSLIKAKRYLKDVLVHKQAIPFTRSCRGVGRTDQANNRHSNGQGRWPAKSAKFILDLLKNAESNQSVTYVAFVKGLDVDALFTSHIQVEDQARSRDGRTYRAHGVVIPLIVRNTKKCRSLPI
ncbi:60S ribosomal protein L17-2-like protein [Tanacetum coccineum]